MQLESVSYLIALRGTDLSNLRAGELPVLFSPDGSKLAAATPVDSVWLWDTKSGDPIGGPLPHEGQVSRLAFNRDSTRLTSASEKTAKVWSTETGEQVHIHPLRHPEPIELLTFCPDGEVVVTASGGVFHHWNAKAKRLIRLPQSYDKLSESVTLCPTGKKFIAASSRARLLDMGVNAHQKVTTEYDANLTSMTFDEQRDRDLDTDNRSGEASRSGPEKSKKVFSQCGCIEAVIDDKQVIRFRDINSGQPVGTEIRFRGNVSAIALNASATQLAIGAEKAVRVWDASTGVPVGEEMLHEAKITQLAFSSDGKTLKTTTEKTDRIWKLPTPGSKDIPRLVKQLAPRRDP
ncbi:MAG: WD40 repeat domain-containing protein [Lacipirellulaceae bacterium]